MPKCNVCRKSMEIEKDKNYIGISLTFDEKSGNKKTRAAVQKQLGEYRIGVTYQVCCECWLKSLGVKP